MKLPLRTLLAVGVSVTALSQAQAFGGEDFITLTVNNWHHADISCRGAAGTSCFRNTNDEATPLIKGTGAGFSTGAAASICWHADYVDSYGYNPLWWAEALKQGPEAGFKRLKAALACKPEITKVHFDDLVTRRLNGGLGGLSNGFGRAPRSAPEVQMRRYLSGTIDGMLYAESLGDVAMAHHILGVSLHAIQDFYSHSNWINEPVRRNKTYFDMATSEWDNLGTISLYTGTYETPTQTGVDSHGKYGFACTIMNQPGIKTLLDVGCGAFSPIASDSTCLQYKECKQGTSIAGAAIVGVTIPSNVLYFAPAGINLDSKWGAEIGAKQRKIVAPDFTARQAFDTAEGLAIKASEQWLRRVGMAMEKLGKGSFWRRVSTENSVGTYNNPSALAISQWENFGKLGYHFVSAGTYPPKATDNVEEHFLRLKIKTSTDANSGTNADIIVKANNQEFLLDNMPMKGESALKKAISYNDFEQGDDDVYLVGPFKSIPTSFTLENRSKSAGEVVLAAGEAFVKAVVEAVKTVVDGIVGFFKTLFGSDPDFVQKNQKVWRFNELPQSVGSSQDFSIDLNGGDEGHYVLRGDIRKTADVGGLGAQGNAEYVVRVTQLHCIKESKFDRLSNSDEPFVACFVNALDGQSPKSRRALFGPFDDVDDGETRSINHSFPAVTIPKGAGVISFPVLLMESDDESAQERQDILNKFAGDTEPKVKEDTFLDVLGAAVAPDWKVDRIEAWTFSKGDQVRSARTGLFNNVGWIEGKQSKSFSLSTPPNTGLRAQDLEDMTGVTLSASESTKRPLVALLSLTVGASLLGLGLIRLGREK